MRTDNVPKNSVVVSVFAIIILSIIGGLFKVCPPPRAAGSSKILMQLFYDVQKIVSADGCVVIGGPS